MRPVLEIAAANDPGALAIPAPILIAQGGSDDTVMPAWTDSVARQLFSHGDGLDYSVYPQATHETIVGLGAHEAADWIAARFAVQPETSDCDALPKAAPAG